MCTCHAGEPAQGSSPSGQSGQSESPSGSASKLKDAKFVPYYGQKSRTNQMQEIYLNEAAQVFVAGIESGAKPEQMLKGILGSKTVASLSDEYIEKIAVTLAKRADKVEERRKEEDNKVSGYRIGQKLYERGFYDQAMQQFELAEEQVGRDSRLGGELRIWIALCWMAKGNDEEAVRLFTELSTGHPVNKVRTRAANLCLVAKAPVIKLDADEKVVIPVVKSDRNSNRSRRRVVSTAQRKEVQSNNVDLLFSRLSFGGDFSDMSESELLVACVSLMASPLVLVGWQIIQRRLA